MDEHEWPYFEQALRTDGLLGALLDSNHRRNLTSASQCYDRLKPDLLRASKQRKIPKILHQIWLGSPLPAELSELSKSWLSNHPDWDYRLWTDNEVKDFDFANRDLFEQTDCWGQKSDILRAEIVNQIGGVYVDLDYVNYKNIDEIVGRYEYFGTLRNIFTAYLGWPEVWRWPVVACNSLFGSRPGHPVLSNYLKMVREEWQRRDRFELVHGELPRMALAAIGGANSATRIKEAGIRTYLPYHHVVMDYLKGDYERFIMFPPVFFNPVMAGAATLYVMPDFWKRCFKAGIKLPDIRPYNRRMPYSLGSHLSKQSWL